MHSNHSRQMISTSLIHLPSSSAPIQQEYADYRYKLSDTLSTGTSLPLSFFNVHTFWAGHSRSTPPFQQRIPHTSLLPGEHKMAPSPLLPTERLPLGTCGEVFLQSVSVSFYTPSHLLPPEHCVCNGTAQHTVSSLSLLSEFTAVYVCIYIIYTGTTHHTPHTIWQTL